MSNYFRIGICGEPGSGKTTIIKTIRKDARILILNTEGGLNSIAGYLELNKQNITVRDIRAYDDISKLKKYQESDIKDFDYIVVDTLSFMYKVIARHYIKDTQKVANVNEIQHYNQMSIDLFDVLNAFKNLKVNIIFLIHTKNITDKFQQRFIQLDFAGNQATSYIVNDLDFIFYIMKHPTKGDERILITQNMKLPEPDNRMLEFCKKRDEFNVINKVEKADINHVLTNFIQKRNNVLQQYQQKEMN